MSGAVSEPVDSTRKLAQMSRTAKPVTQHVVGRQHPGTLHQRGPVADHRQDTRSSAAATTRNFFNEPGTGARLIPLGRHGDPATSPAHFLFRRISPMEEMGSGGKREKRRGEKGQRPFCRRRWGWRSGPGGLGVGRAAAARRVGAAPKGVLDLAPETVAARNPAALGGVAQGCQHGLVEPFGKQRAIGGASPGCGGGEGVVGRVVAEQRIAAPQGIMPIARPGVVLWPGDHPGAQRVWPRHSAVAGEDVALAVEDRRFVAAFPWRVPVRPNCG